MADSITAVVDTQTNEFVPSGHAPDGRYLIVAVPTNPDPIREKYSGNPADPIAAKTAPETTATLDAQKDAQAAAQFDMGKVLKAVALSNLAARLGKAPGALTPAEISAERARIIAIYKAL